MSAATTRAAKLILTTVAALLVALAFAFAVVYAGLSVNGEAPPCLFAKDCPDATR